MDEVGITSTIPLEIPLAAGVRVIDLNNLFIGSPEKQRLVEYAEECGFPHNTCCWIKGIYGAVKRFGIKTVIAVTEGDCSNTHALMEIFTEEGIRAIPFAYPYNRNKKPLNDQIEALMEAFQVDWGKVGEVKKRLDKVRKVVHEIDRLSWRENRVTGWENHFFQVSCSDMGGDAARFMDEASDFLQKAKQRFQLPRAVRLGYLGVPPVFPQLYEFLESKGARVVYNEIQRQFSMPGAGADLLEQYWGYTYPYDIFARLQDIKEQIRLRRLDGLIHYTQSFCFRQIEDIIIRKHIKLPILTLEGDAPSGLDMRTKLRLEGFVESLSAKAGR